MQPNPNAPLYIPCTLKWLRHSECSDEVLIPLMAHLGPGQHPAVTEDGVQLLLEREYDCPETQKGEYIVMIYSPPKDL